LNIYSRILHFVSVVFGRNSCYSQRTLSKNVKLVHTIKKPLYGISSHKLWIFIQECYILSFCHCCVWKKQLWLSKIPVNTCKTVSYYKKATLKNLMTQTLNIYSRILHFVSVVFGRNSCYSQRTLSTHLKLVHAIDKPLYGISSDKFWNIHSRIFHFVIVVFGRNSCDSQRTLSTHVKLVHAIDKPLYRI
jgi:hypothetical protein